MSMLGSWYLIRPLQSLLDLFLDGVVCRIDAGNVVDSLRLAADAPAKLDGLLREAVRRNLRLGVDLHSEIKLKLQNKDLRC